MHPDRRLQSRTTETVARIANSVSGVTDSLVTPAGDRLGVRVGGTVNWFLPDLHGDIAASLSADETIVTNAIRYDAYGQTIATGTAGGTAVGAATWKYQGRLDLSPTASGPLASGTPLYDLGARLYAPGLGTFTQMDTVAGSAQHPLSMNRFLYAEANPATLVDPTGHCTRYMDGICADVRSTAASVAWHRADRARRATWSTEHRSSARGRSSAAIRSAATSSAAAAQARGVARRLAVDEARQVCRSGLMYMP